MAFVIEILHSSRGPIADAVMQAAFQALTALMHTRHGSVRELSAIVLRQMTPNILGIADSSGTSAAKTATAVNSNAKHAGIVRTSALAFIKEVARYNHKSQRACAVHYYFIYVSDYLHAASPSCCKPRAHSRHDAVLTHYACHSSSDMVQSCQMSYRSR